MVICILVGSVFVHCTQTMVTSMDGIFDGGHHDTKAGAIKDAKADTGSCVACDREQPTVIFDDLVEPTKLGVSTNCYQATPVFDVSAYRTVVVHAAKCGALIQVRNGKAGFVSTTRDSCNDTDPPTAMFANPLLGRELRVNVGAHNVSATNPDGLVGCSSPPIAVTIVGYKNP